MSNVIDPQAEGGKYEKWARYGFIAVGAAITLPLALYALEGLVIWGAFAACLFILWNFAPVFSTYVANKRIQALVAVIEANPIETMQNLYIEKCTEFKHQEDAVTEFDTQFQNVSDLVENLKNSDPDEAIQYAAMRDKMKEGLDELRVEQDAARIELHNAKTTIDKMKRLWTVACAMNKALAASASASQQVFNQIKQDVSIDTVRTNLNRAFANLNTAVERRKNVSMLSPSKVVAALPEANQVIDITAIGKHARVTS